MRDSWTIGLGLSFLLFSFLFTFIFACDASNNDASDDDNPALDDDASLDDDTEADDDVSPDDDDDDNDDNADDADDHDNNDDDNDDDDNDDDDDTSPPLPAPTALAAARVSHTGVELSWEDQSTEETGFTIQRATAAETWSEIGQVGANAENFTDTGLAWNLPYRYRVRAFNEAGISAWSDPDTAPASDWQGFLAPLASRVDQGSLTLNAADLNGDGLQDLVSIDFNGADYQLAVLLNQSNGTFRNAGFYKTGDGYWSRPEAVAVADLDGDQDLDLAVASMEETTSLLFNDGTGQFTGPTNLDDYWQLDVAAADFDGDGDADLAAVAPESGNLVFLWNQGDGSFPAQTLTSVGTWPMDLVTADLDGDTDVDIAVNVSGLDSLAVLLNDGSGGFSKPVYYTTWYLSDLLTLDIDKDGDIDILGSCASSQDLVVFTNQGDGSLADPLPYQFFEGARTLKGSDLDLDGDPDLLILSEHENWEQISGILLNDGAGQFSAQGFQITTEATAMEAADFDGDGNADFAVAFWEDAVHVFINDGAAGFPQAPMFELDDQSSSLVAADFNRDGWMDLATSDQGIILNDQAGGFTESTACFLGSEPGELKAADINGDDWPDLAFCSENHGNVGVVWNREGAFPFLEIRFDFYYGPQKFAAADLDNDGDLDFVEASGSYYGELLIGRNDGLGNFEITIETYLGSDPTAMAQADIDLDGDMDLLMALRPLPTTAAETAEDGYGLRLLVNNGAGSFSFGGEYLTDIAVLDIAAGDLNHDGAPDLAVASGNGMHVLLNDGAGQFGGAVGYAAGSWPVAVTLDDLDGDGDPDAAVVNYSSDNLSTFLNQGDGTFVAGNTHPTGDRPTALESGDLDGDGDLDLAALNHGDNTLTLFFNAGDGAFPAVATMETLAYPAVLRIHDLNHDNAAELLIGYDYSKYLTACLNDGAGDLSDCRHYLLPGSSFADPFEFVVANFDADPESEIVAGSDYALNFIQSESDGALWLPLTTQYRMRPVDLAVGDVDGDGDNDIVTADYDDDCLSVVLNHANQSLEWWYAIPLDDWPIAVALDDLNGDDRVDLTITTYFDELLVLLNQGDGTFVEAFTFNCGEQLRLSVVFDANLDGALDIALLADTSVFLLLNDGQGNWQTAGEYPVFEDSRRLLTPDVNGDGWPDFVVLSAEGQSVAVLLNNGDGSFAQAVAFGAPGYPDRLVGGDFDNDGDFDLIAAETEMPLLLMLPNLLVP